MKDGDITDQGPDRRNNDIAEMREVGCGGRGNMEEERRREEARQREQDARAAFQARQPRGAEHFRALCRFQANLYCLFYGESCEGLSLSYHEIIIQREFIMYYFSQTQF